MIWNLDRLKWNHQPLLRPYTQQSMKKIGEARWDEMKWKHHLNCSEATSFIFPPSLTERLFFSSGIFDLQVKPPDFLPKLYLPVVYASGEKKILLVGIDEKKKTISIDMAMSTKTNITEIIEISVQWRTGFVFPLAPVLKINSTNLKIISFWPSFYFLSHDQSRFHLKIIKM